MRQGFERRSLVAVATLFLLQAVSAGAEPPGLEISATYPETGSTGTMHYANRVKIALGTLEPLVLQGSEDFGVPIPGPQYRLDDRHFVLLAWASSGAGMQDLHALLIEIRGKALAVAQELVLMTDRPSAGVVVRPAGSGSLKLGVVDPGEFLHNEEDWSYSAGGKVLDAAAIRALPYEAYIPAAGDSVYAPPFGKLPEGRIAWITVTARGFAFPPKGTSAAHS
ncbi:MAG TPA: hypothetical protein VGX68_04515 [Thermoanaerobaculia bacterium]|nr:hypothetical protein [Thermoanaerobaculia bacterium]